MAESLSSFKVNTPPDYRHVPHNFCITREAPADTHPLTESKLRITVKFPQTTTLMSEAKKRSSSQAGLSDEDYEDSDVTVHSDSDSHSDQDSDDQHDEVETRLVNALREVSGNRQKTVLLTPPPEVDDAGIIDRRPGREEDRDSAVDADDEREPSSLSENGDASDDDKENRPPVEADEEHEEPQEGEDEGEDAVNRERPYAGEDSGPQYPQKRKIKRRRKYEAEADHSEAIRQKYIEMRKTRTPIACDRCKNLRKECTIHEEGCLQCQTIKAPCMHTDPITLITERRGASKRKDEKMQHMKACIIKLQRQVQAQMYPYGPPLGQYAFPQHRSDSPNPRSLSPHGNSARWGHASSGSSAEKGAAYANRNGLAASNSHNNIASSRKPAKRNGGHASVTKSRPLGSDSSGSSGGTSGYLAELDKNIGPGGRAKINSTMEKFLERDPDYQKKAYLHPSSPRPRQMSGPGYAPHYQEYHEFNNNAHYPTPPLRPMSTPSHRMYDLPYMGDPRYGHPQPGYVNHAPRYPTPPPPHFRPYPERVNPEYEHVDPRHQYDGGLRSTPDADNDPYYGLPDAGPSSFNEEELIQAYRAFYPEGESTSAGAAEQARASRTRPKFIPRGMPPGNPPPRPRKK
ncbi:hypothetical protein BO82DRAFT_397856 [Aspergillus uvarum CBS 121591]|uniref:Zn(2)-C6 fungal-type domain-containing protein n=1 Tax=Aspergillus uvarum CBS 121591 TaxID=1448315 RepID=A0A319DDF4_9EURO|nr:hypothetical protein BO82DRAFT_397856 [Aspergillus uvarum CBS 121591]PYH86108.1 hypothetical protein BO82DRAFT_397856 [Aspergillus uvarum CBS 121591]